MSLPLATYPDDAIANRFALPTLSLLRVVAAYEFLLHGIVNPK